MLKDQKSACKFDALNFILVFKLFNDLAAK